MSEQHEKPIEYKMRELTSPEDLQEYAVLARFVYSDTHDDATEALVNEMVASDEADPDSRFNKINKQTLSLIERNELRLFGFHASGGPDDGKLVAAGAVTNNVEVGGSPERAYLMGAIVRPSARGNKLAPQLTERRMQWAKSVGAVGVDTQVFSDNVNGLLTKLNEGFYISGVEYDDEKILQGFVVSKEFNETPPAPATEKIEINLADHDAITQYFAVPGWHGVTLKNIGAREDKSTKNWTLVLEK